MELAAKVWIEPVTGERTRFSEAGYIQVLIGEHELLGCAGKLKFAARAIGKSYLTRAHSCVYRISNVHEKAIVPAPSSLVGAIRRMASIRLPAKELSRMRTSVYENGGPHAIRTIQVLPSASTPRCSPATASVRAPAGVLREEIDREGPRLTRARCGWPVALTERVGLAFGSAGSPPTCRDHRNCCRRGASSTARRRPSAGTRLRRAQ